MDRRRDLANFLKEHEGEWWTPFEIKKELGADLRTVKNNIRDLNETPWETTYEGWKLDIAERGDRLYVVRMVMDMEGSTNLIRAEISEVNGIPVERLEEILNQQNLILKHVYSTRIRDTFLRYLQKASHHHDSKMRLNYLEKLKEAVKEIKEIKLNELNEVLKSLSECGEVATY